MYKLLIVVLLMFMVDVGVGAQELEKKGDNPKKIAIKPNTREYAPMRRDYMQKKITLQQKRQIIKDSRKLYMKKTVRKPGGMNPAVRQKMLMKQRNEMIRKRGKR